MGMNAQTPETTREKWDFINAFRTSTGRQNGVFTDGEFIYTSAWGVSSAGSDAFFKYSFEGELIESFNIPGCPYLLDVTYDGQYFYGGSIDHDGILYCFDLVNRTFVGSVNTPCPGPIYHCSYDPVNDGFWIGQSSTLMLVSRNGALVNAFPDVIVSNNYCHGTGYFEDEEGSHLLMLIDVGIHPSVFDYNITTNTFNNDPVLNFELTPGYVPYGGAGGVFVGAIDGRCYFFGTEQSSPNMVAIYDLGEGDAPVPPVPPTPVDGDYFYDFEDGVMQWTTIDADGDGHNWEMKSYGTLGSYYCVTSCSNYGGLSLEPDNYLVSPVKDFYSEVRFKAHPQDAQYNAEHIGIAVSTGSNTNPEDFVTVWETTLTGTPWEWEEFSVDINGYAGQEIWVAFRHFNCKDKFWVNVDDITLFVDPTDLAESFTEQLNVCPNPVNDRLVVRNDQIINRLDIYTVTGALVYSREVRASSFDVDVESLPSGTYIIRLTSEGVIQTRKFLKN